MATRTRVQASRAYDHLYDPTYAASGASDVGREHMRAAYATGTVARAPVYDNMFSDNQSYPRAMYQMKVQDTIPSADTAFRPPETDLRTKKAQSHVANVQGPNRSKYFKRPVVPQMGAVDASVLLKTTSVVDPLLPPIKASSTPRTRTVGTMSDYRESEAQTDPYTPEFTVVGDNPHPELLTLASFSHGHGLPAGLAEVEMIEKAREKRAWEANLPPLDNPETFHIRQAMMEEMEMKEWQEREEEIRKLQEMRLEMLRKVMETREVENEEANDARVRQVWESKMVMKQGKIEKIERNRIKALRKLAEARKNVDGKNASRDIIGEYSDYASKVYAPKTRDGTFADKLSRNEALQGPALNPRALRVLEQISATAPSNLLEPRVATPQRSRHAATPQERKTRRIQKQLEMVDKALKAKKDKTPKKRPPIKCAKRVEKPPPRPPTPEIEAPDSEEEEASIAATLLQRLIRGRAGQNLMFEGKEHRLPLIQELRTLHAVSEAERNEIASRKEALIDTRKANLEAVEKQALVDAAVESIQGEIVGETLDFLCKELVRLREERRIASIAMLAQRERAVREKREAVLRKAEEAKRLEEDAVYRQTMRTHRQTVASYLDSIVADAVDETAASQAMGEARLKAQRLNTIVSRLERGRDSPETIVQDLVSSFLFPEVERRSNRSMLERNQKNYSLASNAAVAAIGIGDTVGYASPMCAMDNVVVTMK